MDLSQRIALKTHLDWITYVRLPQVTTSKARSEQDTKRLDMTTAPSPSLKLICPGRALNTASTLLCH